MARRQRRGVPVVFGMIRRGSVVVRPCRCSVMLVASLDHCSTASISMFTASYANNRRNGFSYDLAGNLTNDLGQTFTYDATGQQVTASYSGYALTQVYDGDTLRVKKTENGVSTYYLRSTVLDGNVVAEINWFSVAWGWSRRSSAAEALTASPEKT